ncbi:dTDP-4-dehydrorhamnose 3,5-epimerase [Legionella impletisoli]|uniref:dTDP-4-dehydrorhamnose 3,5-epimerase n=1 Tax=Legionella impletisoli TaxID=343510 RepID=A0A917JQL7_9GAMM|nr:dTDP-4-dehydrorhamnose 3,5-epimerase [Legionella impletisoli]GGI81993.1 dTDP-4-dehydrorhamnose 3,5-epimerase [Legionella impletisoli]
MAYKVFSTDLPEVLVLEPNVIEDERGFFLESFNSIAFSQATGIEIQFLQDNHSRSSQNVLRGLHYQIQHSQGKLVRVVQGAVFDVAVDLRKDSEYFGKWSGVVLSEANKRQLWIPPGFAHGFVVISERADLLYKTTDYWYPKHERCLIWNDPSVNIDWPLKGTPKLAEKDAAGKLLTEADLF